MKQAQQFAEEMSKPEAVASVEVSNSIAAKYSFKRVRFTKENNRPGLRFADGSKLYFGDGTFLLPIQEGESQ